MATHTAYASTKNNKIVSIETELSSLPMADAPYIYMHAA